MAIESGRLVIGTEKRDLSIGPTGGARLHAKVRDTAPRLNPYYDTDLGKWLVDLPDYVGQVYVHNIDNQYANVYVAVKDTPMTETKWVRVRGIPAQVIDQRTGQPYDANLSFYSNLAS